MPVLGRGFLEGRKMERKANKRRQRTAGQRGKLNLELRTWLKHLNLKRNMSSSGKSQQCQLINWSPGTDLHTYFSTRRRPRTARTAPRHTFMQYLRQLRRPAGLKQKRKACLIIRAKTTWNRRHLPCCQRQKVSFVSRIKQQQNWPRSDVNVAGIQKRVKQILK